MSKAASFGEDGGEFLIREWVATHILLVIGFTPASHIPTKLGAASGENFNSKEWTACLVIASSFILAWYTFFSSLLAQTK